MQTITLKSVTDGRNHRVLKDDAKLTNFKLSSIVDWEFDLRDEDTGSVIRSNGFADEMNVSRDELGRYNHVGYQLAYNKGYVINHVTRYKQGALNVEMPSRDVLMQLPDVICEAVVAKAQSFFDLASVLEPKTETESKTGSQPGD